MEQRKYLPTLAELIDRLSISQLKEVFITDHKEEYAQEIADIVHDIELLLTQTEDRVTGEQVRAIIVLAQMNLHILNGIRNTAKNKIQEVMGGRKDYKIDCLAAEFKDWDISWENKNEG